MAFSYSYNNYLAWSRVEKQRARVWSSHPLSFPFPFFSPFISPPWPCTLQPPDTLLHTICNKSLWHCILAFFTIFSFRTRTCNGFKWLCLSIALEKKKETQLASNQALPWHFTEKRIKQGESQEDFDHMLDMVGHALITCWTASQRINKPETCTQTAPDKLISTLQLLCPGLHPKQRNNNCLHTITKNFFLLLTRLKRSMAFKITFSNFRHHNNPNIPRQ